MEKKYYRDCPSDGCTNIIGYKAIYDKISADKKQTRCNSCRYREINERNDRILNLLIKTTLNYGEISKELDVSIHIIKYVSKKHKIERKSKISEECRIIRSNNFKKNVLDKKLNMFGGGNQKSYQKIFKTRFGYEYKDFLKKQPEFKKYYNEVRNITLKNLRKYKSIFTNLNNIGRCGEDGKFQIDHIFSIKKGFELNIIPHLIGHPSNLQIISWEDNLKKSDRCDISLDVLINNTSSFLTKNHKILIPHEFRN